jgi:receptor expression-enhancing protein 1/2/3/4
MIRAGFMLWLVLPGFQGSSKLYMEYVHPQLEAHEREIEDFIARSHEQAKAAGLEYVRKLIEYVKQQVLGSQYVQQQTSSQPAQPQDAAVFIQNLFTRWRVAPISPYAPQMATDFYRFMSTALQQQNTAGDGAVGSASLIPPEIEGKMEKTRFIMQQKQRVQALMAALEREENSMQGGGDIGGTSIASVLDETAGAFPSEKGFYKSPSMGNMSSHEGDFDHVTMSDATSEGGSTAGGPPGWGLFGWGGKPQPDTPIVEEKKEQ